MQDVTPEQVSDLMRHRRTIKPSAFDGRPIDEQILRTLLENANWAPTHGMTEPWRFKVFLGPAKRRLAEKLSDIYRRITPPLGFKQNKFDGMSRNAILSSCVIAICMKRQESEKIPELDEIQAVACAVQNIHLTAAAFGIGGFWSSNHAACSNEMRIELGLGEKDRILGLFYLGYPAEPWPAGQRTPIEDKTEWFRE